MTSRADLIRMRAKARAEIESAFDVGLLQGRSRSTARAAARGSAMVSLRASAVLELVAEFERMMAALEAVTQPATPTLSPASHSCASPPPPDQTPR